MLVMKCRMLQSFAFPQKLHDVVSQILQLEMERLSLSKAVSDKASKQRLQALDSQLKKLKGEQVKTHGIVVATI